MTYTRFSRPIINQRDLSHGGGLAFLAIAGIFASIAAPGITGILDSMDEGNSFKKAIYIHVSENSFVFLGIEAFVALLLVLTVLIFLYPFFEYLHDFPSLLRDKIKRDKDNKKYRIYDCGDAWMAFYSHDYRTAYEKFEPLAELGYPSAQCGLGLLYESGWYVQENYEQAIM